MELLIWLVVGAIAGWLASIIMGTNAQMGLVSNIVVGIIGSVLGGAIVILLNGGGLQFSTAYNDFNMGSIIVSTLGAIVLLAIVKAFNRSPAT